MTVDRNWRGSSLPSPGPAGLAATLPDQLIAWADTYEDRLAIVSATQRVTFRELLGQAGALAQAIHDTGAPDGPVALLLPAGVAYIAAWFACAAIGRPMLMVEFANPPARNAALLQAAGATLVLHDGSGAALEAADNCVSLALPPLLPPRPLPQENFDVDEPAFLFATSGSSGVPKLVVYAQRTVQAKVQCSAVVMGVRPGDVVLIAGSHANFGVLHHALVFLCCGGTLCIHDMRDDGLQGMFDAILHHDVTQMRFTPSLFRTAVALPQAAAALRRITAVRFAGEALLRTDLDLVRVHCAPGCRVQNLYGSTESMIFFWSDDMAMPPDSAVVPNGRIYPVAEFTLIAEDGGPAAEGAPGELVISSCHHALGDWRDGCIDTSRFPPDPRGGGRRLYYTGDIVRLAPDGAMIVLGRKDRLVKVNGQRVSLPEIEGALQAMPGCAQVAVLIHSLRDTQQLVAFLVGGASAGLPADPGAWLAERLPRYMVPQRFDIVPELPLLAGGKIDGRSLLARLTPAPADAGRRPMPRAQKPRQSLTELWTKILRIPPEGSDRDFFALGGDSLKLLELQLAIEQKFGHRIDSAAFLRSATLDTLVDMLGRDAARPRSWPAAPAATDALRFDAQGLTTLRLMRPARGSSCGIVLGMPGREGHPAHNGVVAANAFADYDVWTFAADIGLRTMVQDGVWIACAREMATQIQARHWLRPRAVFGYSFAGYIGWVVDRLLQAAGLPPTPVINFDAGLLHHARPDLQTQLDGLSPDSGAATRMLLFRRGDPGPFRLRMRIEAEWAAAGVQPVTVICRTLDHMDVALPYMSAAASDAVADFIEAGDTPAGPVYADIPFDTVGGRLYDMLASSDRPDLARIRALLDSPECPMQGACSQALLLLVVATGAMDPALDYATRLLATGEATLTSDDRRAALYAQARLLQLMGRRQEAAWIVEHWCQDAPADRVMQESLDRQPQPLGAWGGRSGQTIGSVAALDSAFRLTPA